MCFLVGLKVRKNFFFFFSEKREKIGKREKFKKKLHFGLFWIVPCHFEAIEHHFNGVNTPLIFFFIFLISSWKKKRKKKLFNNMAFNCSICHYSFTLNKYLQIHNKKYHADSYFFSFSLLLTLTKKKNIFF